MVSCSLLTTLIALCSLLVILGKDYDRKLFSSENRNLFDKRQLPKLHDSDIIELYHLRSFPLLLIQSTSGTFSTQTSGLALRSTTTGDVIVLEFKPKNISNCFLPILGTTGKTSISWDKRAEVIYSGEIDTSYWQQSTFLSRINGVVYKNYIRWIDNYIKQNQLFMPQSICSSVEELSCFTFAMTWDTFLADSVSINAIIPPRGTELIFLSFYEPVQVNLTSSQQPAVDQNSTSVNGTDISPSEGDLPQQTLLSESEVSDLHRIVDSDPIERRVGNVRRRTEAEAPAVQEEEEGGELDIPKHISADDDNFMFNNYGSDQQQENDSEKEHGEGGADAGATGSGSGGGEAGTNSTSSNSTDTSENVVTEKEVFTYYNNLMTCMQEYQLEDYTIALKSCLVEQVGYVHIVDNRYYQIKPRYPYIYTNEYLQYIPSPEYRGPSGTDDADFLIIVVFAVAALLGLFASLRKLQFFEWLLSEPRYRPKLMGKRIEPPTDGGYVQEQRNDLSTMLYRAWDACLSGCRWITGVSRPTKYSRLPSEEELSELMESGVPPEDRHGSSNSSLDDEANGAGVAARYGDDTAKRKYAAAENAGIISRNGKEIFTALSKQNGGYTIEGDRLSPTMGADSENCSGSIEMKRI